MPQLPFTHAGTPSAVEQRVQLAPHAATLSVVHAPPHKICGAVQLAATHWFWASQTVLAALLGHAAQTPPQRMVPVGQSHVCAVTLHVAPPEQSLGSSQPCTQRESSQ